MEVVEETIVIGAEAGVEVEVEVEAGRKTDPTNLTMIAVAIFPIQKNRKRSEFFTNTQMVGRSTWRPYCVLPLNPLRARYILRGK